MKAILHVGMPKTGSSSIQETLAKARILDPRYLLPHHPNHSGIVRYLFEERGWAKQAKLRGVGSGALERIRDRYQRDLDEAMSDAKSAGAPVVFSAERLSNIRREAAEAIADYFRARCENIEVIGYVRSPRSWATSAFQQNIKGIHKPVFQELLKWPQYREKFEKFDDIFGRENVTLIKFDRATLAGGDVVTDFCQRIGAVSITPEDHVFENDTLSLEGCALLYVKRKLGKPNWAVMHSGSARTTLIAALKPVGGTKLALSTSLFEPLLQSNIEDLRWMEARLGADLDEPPSRATAGAVESEESLLEAAVAAAPLLDMVAPGLAPDRATPETVAAAIDTYFDELMAKTAEAVEQKRARKQSNAGSPLARAAHKGPRNDNSDHAPRRHQMTDMTQDTPETEAEGPNKARAALARTLWKVNVKSEGRTFESAEQRREAYKNEKKPFMAQANKVLRALDKAGYSLTEKAPS